MVEWFDGRQRNFNTTVVQLDQSLAGEERYTVVRLRPAVVRWHTLMQVRKANPHMSTAPRSDRPADRDMAGRLLTLKLDSIKPSLGRDRLST